MTKLIEDLRDFFATGPKNSRVEPFYPSDLTTLSTLSVTVKNNPQDPILKDYFLAHLNDYVKECLEVLSKKREKHIVDTWYFCWSSLTGKHLPGERHISSVGYLRFSRARTRLFYKLVLDSVDEGAPKIHLYLYEYETLATACGLWWHAVNFRFRDTVADQITCKSCMKTKAYKTLKESTGA